MYILYTTVVYFIFYLCRLSHAVSLSTYVFCTRLKRVIVDVSWGILVDVRYKM